MRGKPGTVEIVALLTAEAQRDEAQRLLGQLGLKAAQHASELEQAKDRIAALEDALRWAVSNIQAHLPSNFVEGGIVVHSLHCRWCGVAVSFPPPEPTHRDGCPWANAKALLSPDTAAAQAKEA